METFAHLLDSIGETGIKPPSPLSVENLKDIHNLLLKWRIPITAKWGRGKAKTVSTLCEQVINANEARLYECRYQRRTRGLIYRRVVTIRTVHDLPRGITEYDTSLFAYENGTVVEKTPQTMTPRLLEGRLLLMEFSQEFGLGLFNPAKHPKVISETVGFHEKSFEAAAIRAWTEEFGFAPSDAELASLMLSENLAEDITVSSYDPGIPMLPGYVRDLSGDSTKYPGLLSVKDIAAHTMTMFEHFDPNGYIERKPEKISVFKWIQVA